MNNIRAYNNTHLLSHSVSAGQESGTGSVGVSSSECLVNLQSRCWLGLQSPEGLTRARGSTSKMGHSRGCWREASVHHHMDLRKVTHLAAGGRPQFIATWTSLGSLECPHDMAPGFCQSGWSKGKQDEGPNAFIT